MTRRMLAVKHPVGQPVHRPGSGPVGTDNRGIHGDEHRFLAFHFLPHRRKQLTVALRIAESGYPAPLPVPLHKADPVMLFLPPCQVNPHQQHLHPATLPAARRRRKPDRQIGGSRLAPLLG